MRERPWPSCPRRRASSIRSRWKRSHELIIELWVYWIARSSRAMTPMGRPTEPSNIPRHNGPRSSLHDGRSGEARLRFARHPSFRGTTALSAKPPGLVSARYPSNKWNDPSAYRNRSCLQPRGHLLVLACNLHSGAERHGLHKRGEILLQIRLRIVAQRRGAEVALQHLAHRRGHRHRHLMLAAEREPEVEGLAQQVRRERGRPFQAAQSARFLPRELQRR